MPSQQPKVDLTSLEKQVTTLQKNLGFVGQSNNTDSSELFKIIHHPGWTTVAQVELVNRLLESMNQQALAMRGLRNVIETHVTESGTGG